MKSKKVSDGLTSVNLYIIQYIYVSTTNPEANLEVSFTLFG